MFLTSCPTWRGCTGNFGGRGSRPFKTLIGGSSTDRQLVSLDRREDIARRPAEIISHAVWLYYRFPLSFRDVEDLLAERGIDVPFQTVSEWAAKFGLKFAHQLRRRSRGHFADKWQLDEMVVTIKGKKYWLWRAIDANGYVLDELLQSRRNERSPSPDAQAAQGSECRPTRYGDRQAAVLFRREGRVDAGCRTSLPQRIEQPSGEFASSHTTTGAAHDAIQVGKAMPAFRLYPWPNRKSLTSSPKAPVCRRSSQASRSRHLDLAGNRCVDRHLKFWPKVLPRLLLG